MRTVLALSAKLLAFGPDFCERYFRRPATKQQHLILGLLHSRSQHEKAASKVKPPAVRPLKN